MAQVSIQYTCPQTQTSWKIEPPGIIDLKLGSERSGRDSAAAELIWFQERLAELSQSMPNQSWSVLIDMSKVPVSQNQAIALQELFTDILKNDKIKSAAVIQSARTFQVAIRKILIKMKVIGKLKFFEQKDLAKEWLYLKK